MSELVSIIIPIYNTEEFIEETLESALSQSYKNIELICIDDCSPDNSIDIVKKYMNVDSRVVLIRLNKNSKLPAARNTGIKIAQGKYILPLDSDDLISKTYVEKALNAFKNNSAVDVVYTNSRLFGVKNETNRVSQYSPNKMVITNYVYCTAMYRRSDWEKYNGYSEKMIYGAEDWDFWLNFVEDEAIFYRIDEELFHYRIRAESLTSISLKEKSEYIFKQIKSNHPKLYSIRARIKNPILRKHTLKLIRHWIFTLRTRKGEQELRILGLNLIKKQ